jgi:hypothetical protein
MGTFNASLRTIGDSRGLPAVVVVEDDRFAIRVGDQEIGDWAFHDVSLEATGGSVYRMEAEGDHVLLDLEDVPAFQMMLDERSKMRSRRLVRPAATKRVKEKKEKKEAPPTAVVEKKPKLRRDKKAKTPDPAERTNRLLGLVDRVVAAAERRWGSLLPEWVFTRVTALSLVILAVTTIFLPGLISVMALVIGMIGVLFGAVAYTDLVVAARWLPGRMTATHLLLGGMGMVILGVLLGILA